MFWEDEDNGCPPIAIKNSSACLLLPLILSPLTLPSYFGLLKQKVSNSSLSPSYLCTFSYPARKHCKIVKCFSDVSIMSYITTTWVQGSVISHLKHFREVLKLVFLPLLFLFNLSYTQLPGCLPKQVPALLRPLRISSHHPVCPASPNQQPQSLNADTLVWPEWIFCPPGSLLMLLPLRWGDSYCLSWRVQFKCHYLNLQMRWLSSSWFPITSMAWVCVGCLFPLLVMLSCSMVRIYLSVKKLPSPIIHKCAPNRSLKQTRVLHKHSYYHFLLIWTLARFTQDTKNSRAVFFYFIVFAL